MPKDTATKRIIIQVKAAADKTLKTISNQFKNFQRRMNSTSRDIKKLSTSFGTLRNALAGLAGASIAGLGVRELVGIADSMQLLTDRIQAFEGEGVNAGRVMEDLTAIANYAKTDVAALATSYSRLALAMSDVGIKGKALQGISLALQQTFRISGSTIAESAAATIQLSQGMAAGALRGQEMRSVLEQNAVMGELIAKKFNISRGALIKFAETGRVTAGAVLEILADNFDELNERAGKLGQTFEQTIVIAMNKFKLQINSLNQTLGLNKGFAAFVGFLTSPAGLPLLAGSLAAVGIAAAKMTAGVLVATGALKGFNVAMLLNPFTLFVTGMTAILVYADKVTKAFLHVRVAVKEAMLSIAEMGQALTKWLGLGKKAQETDAKLIAGFKRRINADQRLIALIDEKAKKEKEADKSREEQLATLRDSIKAFEKKSEAQKRDMKSLQSVNYVYGLGELAIGKYWEAVRKLKSQKAEESFKKGAIALDEYNKRLKDISKIGTVDRLKDLNDQFKSGSISVYEYQNALEALPLSAFAGDMEKQATSLKSVRDEIKRIELRDLNKQLKSGGIGYKEYNEALKESAMKDLNKDLEAGSINLMQYNSQMAELKDNILDSQTALTGLSAGLRSYYDSVGSVANNISLGVQSVFNNLEDSLVDFVETGKFNFRKFTDAVLKDLNRIIIRSLVLRPLAGALVGGLAGGGTTSGDFGGGNVSTSLSPGTLDSGFAKGGAFGSTGQITAFASGGVVDNPTGFYFGGGRKGLMGEAGPEAIMPLKRTSTGDLGVQATTAPVNVQIINNTGAEVETNERVAADGTRNIEVVVGSIVKQSIANGSLDQTFNANYGLRRRTM